MKVVILSVSMLVLTNTSDNPRLISNITYKQYNIYQVYNISRSHTIKNQEIFAIISEVSEALSLTNNPRQMLDMTLDTLSRVLGANGCWIQLIDHDNGNLPMAASLGFPPDIRHEIASMDHEHSLSNEIVSLGHKIVIPDLNRDSDYDIWAFKKAGFSSLVAVPVMTYRTHGVLGLAYYVKKRFDEDFPELVMIVASLIGMALNKSMLYDLDRVKEKLMSPENTTTPIPDNNHEEAKEHQDTSDVLIKPPGDNHSHAREFTDHIRTMKSFRDSHRIR